MKKLFCFFAFLALVVMVTVPDTVSAQSTKDTVYIPGTQSLQISKIINADTSVTAFRVYKLDRGAIYYIDKAFEITHSCKFIATGDATKRPPVLAPAIRADGSNEEWYFKLIKQGIKVELNDLYLLSMRSDGKTLGWSRAIHVGANNTTLKMRRIVLDGWTEAGIRVDGARYVKLDVQDCHFRNFIHSTSYFGGQPFLSNNLDHPDSTIFINNTFFACNSYLFSVRGLGPKSVFEHNSVIYTVVNPFLTRQADNLYVKNNLFYAVHAWGGNPEQIIGGWFLNYPDTISSSIYQIRKKMKYYGLYDTSGPEAYYSDLSKTYVPANRINVALNNDNFNPSLLTKFYKDWNDTVKTKDSVAVVNGQKVFLLRKLTMADWINGLGKAVIDSLTNPKQWDYSKNISIANNMNVDPGFTDANVVAHVSELIGYVNRIASNKLDQGWQYKMTFPPAWPIPENLAYSNTILQKGGTDGFAVGDLNWFPTQKAQWVKTDIKQEVGVIPAQYKLEQNYPNPFNPTTNIKYSVTKQGDYSVKVYDVLGRLVTTLFNGQLNVGSYSVTFNASNLSSGIYFYSLSGEGINITKKMMLIK